MKYYDKQEKELIEWYEKEVDNFRAVDPIEENRLKDLFKEGLEERRRKDTRVHRYIRSDT